MSDPPSSPASGGRSRRRLFVAGLILVAVVAVVGVVVLEGPRAARVVHRLTTPEITPQPPSPAATRPPVQPGATPNASFPGSTDTIPFTRPVFQYKGAEPWQIVAESRPGAIIEGYASAPSYLPGATLRLAVHTTAPTYSLRIFRVSGSAPIESPFSQVATLMDQPGREQAAKRIDPITKMVWAPWSWTTSFRIPSDWPSGVYLIRLASPQNAQSYVPFVIRSTHATRFLVISNALNWEAYNVWGGSSLYQTMVGQPLPGLDRAFAVSFDRPYSQMSGSGDLFYLELPFLAWIARQGLDVGYTTDYDLSWHPETQPLPQVLVFNGHSEYWGLPLRAWLQTHVNLVGDLGLAVLAGNSGYWPVVLSQPTATGPRVATCYKEGPLPPSVATAASAATSASSAPAASEAPGPSDKAGLPGAPGESLGPEENTTDLFLHGNEPPGGPYVGRLEIQSLLGVDYKHITTAMGRYSLVETNPNPALVAGTSLTGGSSLGFLAGGEVDGHYSNRCGATGCQYDQLFAQSLNIPSLKGMTSTADAVYRDLPNGGRVFSAGTFYWGWALDPNFAKGYEITADFPRLTLNILDWLATRG